MDSFVNDFIVEAKDLILISTDGILLLEKNPGNSDEINKIFRAVHTMKSSSGLVGLGLFVDFLHAAEDSLDDVRKGKIPFTRDLATMLLNMLDKLADWIAIIENSDELPADASAMAKKMANEFRSYKPGAQKTETNSSEKVTPAPVLKQLSVNPISEVNELNNKNEKVATKKSSEPAKTDKPTAKEDKKLKRGVNSLIVEDDFVTGQVLIEILTDFGECQLAENGIKAVELFTRAMKNNKRYDVVYLDIMMPEISGQEVLSLIRAMEKGCGIEGLDAVKIVMCTALGDYDNVKLAFTNQCEGYIVKPISKEKIESSLRDLKLIDN